MNNSELDYKRFHVARYIAQSKIYNEKVYWNSDELFSRINKAGLSDAQALLRIFKKQIDEHNSKLDAMETRVKNLHYKNSNLYQSKHFKDIPIAKIDKAILENPDGDIWDIAKEFIK
ncbi:MAG: hypothetical protein N4A71_02410 [Carboxylicivirga sp.]|jgi:predicted  nucleic acid-binding Zn-ribbon protein|nr:hypothetical protein [Carboxylicivirga sp.]